MSGNPNQWYLSGDLVIDGNATLKAPDKGIYSLQLSRTDESGREHRWAFWHMNSEYRKNSLEIWEYKTDSSGKDCSGNANDGAMCTPRFVISEGGNVGIGTVIPRAKLHIDGGAIMPAAGNSDNAGILFPNDPGGGSGDKAWIRYYARAGGGSSERTALEIGVANDAAPGYQDDILLIPSGGVGIGTREPEAKLEVNLVNDRGWNGNLKGFRLLSPDNGYFLDINTYIVSGGNVGYQFSPNGNNGLVITTPGNVGIGTMRPSAKLEVNLANDKGWNGNLKGLRLLSPDNGYFLDINTYIVSGGNVGYQFSPNGNNGFVITTSGRVGIGTNNPWSTLHLKGNADILSLEGNDHAYIQFFPQSTAQRRGWIGSGSSGDRAFNISSDNERMHITGGENLYLLNNGGVFISRAWGGNGNLSVDGALITHPIDNTLAQAILADAGNGTAIIGAANGINEPRLDFYFKYRDRVYISSMIGRPL